MCHLPGGLSVGLATKRFHPVRFPLLPAPPASFAKTKKFRTEQNWILTQRHPLCAFAVGIEFQISFKSNKFSALLFPCAENKLTRLPQRSARYPLFFSVGQFHYDPRVCWWPVVLRAGVCLLSRLCDSGGQRVPWLWIWGTSLKLFLFFSPSLLWYQQFDNFGFWGACRSHIDRNLRSVMCGRANATTTVRTLVYLNIGSPRTVCAAGLTCKRSILFRIKWGFTRK